MLRHYLGAINDHALTESLKCRRRRKTIERHLILFLELKFRVRNSIQKLAVVGQHQQARRFPVQTSDRDEPFRRADQVEHRATSTFIRGRGDVSGRLVEDDISSLLPLDKLAIDTNLLSGRIDAYTKLGDDLAVNAHAAVNNHSLGFASGR